MKGAEIIYRNKNCIVAICLKISENQLNDVIRNSGIPQINAKSIKRQCEWATTHKLLEYVLGEPVTYCYDPAGKPVLNNRSEKISISHSRNYCAVIVNNVIQAGIDIEEPNNRIYRIADRFLNDYEKFWINKIQNKTEILYLIWCAKEAIYKLTDVKPDFKENLFIEKTIVAKSGQMKASLICRNNKEQFSLFYYIDYKYILVFTQ